MRTVQKLLRIPPLALLACIAGLAGAQPPGQDPTRVVFEAARDAILMGPDIGRSEWPTRLATQSEEGQFEILVRKDTVPVLSPHCRSRYLVLRMPASLGDDLESRATLERKRQEYRRMQAAYAEGRPIRFEASAGPYGKRLEDGRVELSGCNLFLAEPSASLP